MKLPSVEALSVIAVCARSTSSDALIQTIVLGTTITVLVVRTARMTTPARPTDVMTVEHVTEVFVSLQAVTASTQVLARRRPIASTDSLVWLAPVLIRTMPVVWVAALEIRSAITTT